MPQFIPRTTEDDRRSIKRLPAKGNKVPLPTERPIVSWSHPVESGACLDFEDNLSCFTWPSSSTILCHNCCFSFDGVPVPLPQSYDALRKVYHCRGNFCSWQCSKAYNIRQTPPSGRGNRNMYIAILAHKTWAKYRENLDSGALENLETYALYCIQPSLPREALKVFGGDMTIEEYRKGFFSIIPPSEAKVEKPFLTLRKMLVLPFVQDDKKDGTNPNKPVTKKIDTSTVHRYSNAFCAKLNNAKDGKTDKTIMKRKRAINSDNTLMSTMGVVIETKKR